METLRADLRAGADAGEAYARYQEAQAAALRIYSAAFDVARAGSPERVGIRLVSDAWDADYQIRVWPSRASLAERAVADGALSRERA